MAKPKSGCHERALVPTKCLDDTGLSVGAAPLPSHPRRLVVAVLREREEIAVVEGSDLAPLGKELMLPLQQVALQFRIRANAEGRSHLTPGVWTFLAATGEL